MPSIKTFLYTDEKTGQVIFAKNSRHYDYTFSIPGISVSVTEIAAAKGASHPLQNLHLKGTDHLLEKKKLEALVFLRTTECMMIEKIERTLSVVLPLPHYGKLVAEEKKLALARVRKFFAEKHAAVIDCRTVEAVTKFLKDMSDRVNLGVYSAMNQERKNLDAHGRMSDDRI